MTVVGDLIATRPGDRVRITRADPRIMIAADVLDCIAEGYWADCSLNGDLVRIEAENGTWIYRVGEQVPDLFAYFAEWPD